ncbi:hypothetical protein [Flavobacterium sp. 3HN19-14]|uniref:hypothetical protein n=1 Tax=Flavobacterium sp. 3HN19-14 TaxID=3448133 RepID=UPI003EE07EB4
MPFSSMGYNLAVYADSTDVSGRKLFKNRYSGSGGLNKVFIGLGYNVNSKLSIGVDMHYNFGQITTSNSEYKPEEDLLIGSREINKSDMSGFTVNAGMMYKSRFKKKYDVFASLVYSPKTVLKLANERNIATVVYSSNVGDIVVDSENLTVADTELSIPSKVSIGAGFGQTRKWLIGTEITFSQAGYGNRFKPLSTDPIPAVTHYYTAAQKYSLGGYFIPNYNSYTSYFSKITYRAGLRYERTGLVIANKMIEDMAVSAGFGLPLKGTFSNINFGIELGKRGTKANGLIQENYSNISIGLSLNDLWFVKAKYD